MNEPLASNTKPRSDLWILTRSRLLQLKNAVD